MPRVISAASSLPSHCYSQATIRDAVLSIFYGKMSELDKFHPVFANTRIAQRQFVMPLEWYCDPFSPAERSAVYFREGLTLASTAARKALSRAGLPSEAVTHVIFVSSTGVATPTVDAYLINLLNMRSNTKRLPLWGLGCAGGAGGLARAAECALSHPEAVVLVVAMECCSLTLQKEDITKKNIVATSIFADGAAAAVVVGDAVGLASGPEIVATESHLFPDSYRIMGWDMVNDGMQLVLSPKLPALIRSEISDIVRGLRDNWGVPRFNFYITHPGGARVIDAYRDSLMLGSEELHLTEEVLSLHGNMSSVSVLVVLEKWLAGAGTHGGYGLLSAFGPGFSAEMLLLKEG